MTKVTGQPRQGTPQGRKSLRGHEADRKVRAPFLSPQDKPGWKTPSAQRAAEKDSTESATMAARRRLRSFSGLPIDAKASRSPAGTGPKLKVP